MSNKNYVLGIDPGINGAFVLTDGGTLKTWPMPIIENGKNKDIDFDRIHTLLFDLQNDHPELHIFVERAVPMAMGSKGAFSYGRGFAAIEIAIQLLEFTVTYVEPAKWTKEMHEGISADLKPKARSLIAVKRLYPKLVQHLPTKPKGGLHDGPIDALLIAAYGLRKMGSTKAQTKPKVKKETVGDFY